MFISESKITKQIAQSSPVHSWLASKDSKKIEKTKTTRKRTEKTVLILVRFLWADDFFIDTPN